MCLLIILKYILEAILNHRNNYNSNKEGEEKENNNNNIG